jgi:predicted nucleotidyltransferase
MKSFEISSKIPDQIGKLLRDAKAVADLLNLQFILVGAMARDFILAYGCGISTGRLTVDVDLCIEIDRWDRFHEFRQRLIDSGNFTAVVGMPHRLMHAAECPLDIVPFGGIETAGRVIAWPPDGSIQMNALGLRESSKETVTVSISETPLVEIEVISLPALAALKLISWKDRHYETDKDGADLAIILHAYAEIQENQDRLYGECQEYLEKEGFDLTLGGCRMIGRDMAEIMPQNILDLVREGLAEQCDDSGSLALVQQMAKRGRPMGDRDEQEAWALKMLRSLLAGMS